MLAAIRRKLLGTLRQKQASVQLSFYLEKGLGFRLEAASTVAPNPKRLKVPGSGTARL